MVFLPLKDDNPRHHIRFYWVTLALIAACVLTFLWEMSLPAPLAEQMALAFGMVPANVTGIHPLPPSMSVLPAPLTLFSSMFLHSSWGHLLGNMVFLWVFGDNVEDSMGHGKFLVFYLACGLGAAAAQIAMAPGATVPMIGASGAISGVMGAYLLLHPRSKVLVMLFIPWPFRIPAFVVLGLWIAINVMNALSDPTLASSSVAWWAHLGGLITGLVLIRWFKHPHLVLWDWHDENNRPLIKAGIRLRMPSAGKRRDFAHDAEAARPKGRHGPWGRASDADGDGPVRRRSRMPNSGRRRAD